MILSTGMIHTEIKQVEHSKYIHIIIPYSLLNYVLGPSVQYFMLLLPLGFSHDSFGNEP